MKNHLLLLAVCITLSGCPTDESANNPPKTSAGSDSIVLDAENLSESGFILDVLANDTFAATAQKLTVLDQPDHGSVQLDDNGTPDVMDDKLRYMPDTGFLGDSSFTYQITAEDGSVSEAQVKLSLLGLSALMVDVGNQYGSVHLRWNALLFENYGHHYRLLKSQDGGLSFSEIESAANLPLNRREFDLPLNALQFYGVHTYYRLELCDASGQVLTARQVELKTNDSKELITYIKANNEVFGFANDISLSADGNTLAASASGWGVNGVYIYKRRNGRWIQEAFIRPEQGEEASFAEGMSLSADGNTLAVGAYYEVANTDDNISHTGAVYIFRRVNNAWRQQARLFSSNREHLDIFGRSVSLSADGNTLAASAFGEDSNASAVNGDETNNEVEDAGAVYMFAFHENAWSQQAYLKAGKAVAHSGFGISLSMADGGNLLAVGAPRASDGGSVYVYKRSEGQWSLHREVRGHNTRGSDYFGFSVSLSGDGQQLAVSAPYAITATEIPEFTYEVTHKGYGFHWTTPQDVNYLMTLLSGAAYVFEYQDDNWQQVSYIKPPVTGYSQFHFYPSFQRLSLSADGQNLLVGSAADASAATGIEGDALDKNATSSGAVLLFKKQQGDWVQASYLKASNTQNDDAFGTSIAISADGGVIAVGAAGEDSAATGINGDQANNDVRYSGALYLF